MSTTIHPGDLATSIKTTPTAEQAYDHATQTASQGTSDDLRSMGKPDSNNGDCR